MRLAITRSRLIGLAGLFALGWGLLTATGNPDAGWAVLLPGFSYLCCCWLVWRLRPSRETGLLALAGIGCSLVFLAGPQIAFQPLAAALSVVRSGLVLAGYAAMLHFLILYVGAGSGAPRRSRMPWLYIPAFMFWLLVSFRALAPRGESEAFDTYTYVLAGLVTAGYLLAGIVVFLRRYVQATRDERKAYGLRLVLWGSLLGFLPAGLSFVPPFSALPGADYFILALALPPAAWSLAVLRAPTLP